MFLRYHNYHKKGFSIIPPTNIAARNYLARQNFWSRFNFNPETIEKEKLHRLTSSTSLNDIVDIENKERIEEEIAEQILKVLRQNAVSIKTGLISELVCELVDNFARHSESIIAALAMQYYPNLKRIVIAIGDCGIGIRKSLASNPKYSYVEKFSHYDAALKAFEPLVSRTAEGGTGLTEVKEEVLNLNGRLTLTTGDGYVIISPNSIISGAMPYELSGLQMELSFPEEV